MFQEKVKEWTHAAFGSEIALDTLERNYRFLEESLELIQSCGISESDCHKLVSYVFSRPIGDKQQECGGTMVTLAALCNAQQIDMYNCGENELNRCWDRIEIIRKKHQDKEIKSR